MELKIARMNGLGNRFAIIDARGQALADTPHLAQQIEEIDQLLILTKAVAGGDLAMEIYNCDGSVAEACGNGVRCVAWMAMQAGEIETIAIETAGGIIHCRQMGDLVEADMGCPHFEWQEIPLSQKLDTLNIDIEKVRTMIGTGVAVNIGNPHIIFFPENIDMLDLKRIGSFVERYYFFPQRVNVTFAAIKDIGISLRVWERGAGATAACGTAACAALVAACRRFVSMPRSAPVHLPGGTLEISWRKSDDHILMLGGVSWEREEVINV